MTDPALETLNQKFWNKTKPIMHCLVVAVFSIFLALGAYCAVDDLFWPILFIILNLLFTILAIHYAWELETRL